MALQNRVAPDGEIISIAARGTLFGNRGGRFHDAKTHSLGTRRWASRQWICCELNFRNRHRRVWGTGYTELFFCDEVSAMAAGHRPCFECRRSDAIAFAIAMQNGLALSKRPKADEMDLRLHAERLDGRRKRLHPLPPMALPDGAMIAQSGCYFATKKSRLLRWEFSGYRRSEQAIAPDAMVLTPPSILAALHAGFKPRWHASALAYE